MVFLFKYIIIVLLKWISTINYSISSWLFVKAKIYLMWRFAETFGVSIYVLKSIPIQSCFKAKFGSGYLFIKNDWIILWIALFLFEVKSVWIYFKLATVNNRTSTLYNMMWWWLIICLISKTTINQFIITWFMSLHSFISRFSCWFLLTFSWTP